MNSNATLEMEHRTKLWITLSDLYNKSTSRLVYQSAFAAFVNILCSILGAIFLHYASETLLAIAPTQRALMCSPFLFLAVTSNALFYRFCVTSSQRNKVILKRAITLEEGSFCKPLTVVNKITGFLGKKGHPSDAVKIFPLFFIGFYIVAFLTIVNY